MDFRLHGCRETQNGASHQLLCLGYITICLPVLELPPYLNLCAGNGSLNPIVPRCSEALSFYSRTTPLVAHLRKEDKKAKKVKAEAVA